MKGDFSAWNKDRAQNFRGVLHQQGRVLLDRDWNAQTEIFNEWQETAGRDAFGAGVAAVPAEVSQSFKITEAKIESGKIKISANKGRVWADGLLVESLQDITNRIATYLNLPPASVPNPAAHQRDTVILETWMDALNPFQVPSLLIEPALGGVDTTERVLTSTRFRLFRMEAGETCDSIIPMLKDDFSAKGKLTVKLNPNTSTDGDCPVIESGGYTGFEHRLYRIEIAETKKPDAYFKWSQFNGGLVGTGDFDVVNRKVTLHGNINAIQHSGLKDFYLEALEFDATLGAWNVAYAAKATLGPDHLLTLPADGVADEFLGKMMSGRKFFRLWNGIAAIANFAAADKDLPDLVGIKLKFDSVLANKYTPADFWTFEVRAGGLGNPAVLLGDPVTFAGSPPQGIFYHRVPLAELMWTSNVITGDQIEDCRRVFQPLTKQKTCCTYRVGDGIHSHGDFTKIQDAINALPKKEGGEVCVLPGYYEENIEIKAPHNRNIILKGCGPRTVIQFKTNAPVIHIHYGQNIRIESLAIVAHDEGMGIFLEGEEKSANHKNSEKYLKDIVLTELFVKAVKNSAIKGHLAQFLTLSNSIIHIKDFETKKVAVYLAGDDMLIERSEIRVLPEVITSQDNKTKISFDLLNKVNEMGNNSLEVENVGIRSRGGISDPFGVESNAKSGKTLPSDAEKKQSGNTDILNDLDFLLPSQGAAGGLQIGGGSDRVRIIDNLIVSGTGNGITLGSIDLIKNQVVITNHDPIEPKNPKKDCCFPDTGIVDEGDVTVEGAKQVAGPPLSDILIKDNRIFNMGRNGIGVVAFFSLGELDIKIKDKIDLKDKNSVMGLVSVTRLKIIENRIEQCMNISIGDIPEKFKWKIGYGGISLANTETLVIRDNTIVNNGPDFLEPICGIFILSGEGIEISRNHILNNGIANEKEVTSKSVKSGPRGGIFIARARQSNIELQQGFAHKSNFTRDFPAAKIQENIVSAPLGRSLTLFADGAVSVIGNQFTSLGIPPFDFLGLIRNLSKMDKSDKNFLWQIIDLIAGNILIFDLGKSSFLSKNGFQDIKSGEAAQSFKARNTSSVNDQMGTSAVTGNISKRYFSNGNVLFTNNQCHLNLFNFKEGMALAAIFVGSLDDIGFHNNQTDCDIDDDFLLVNTFVFGISLRVSDNHFTETISKAIFSAMTLGVQNITTDNESIHCLMVKGTAYLSKHNLVFTEIATVNGDISEYVGPHLCDDGKSSFDNFGMVFLPG